MSFVLVRIPDDGLLHLNSLMASIESVDGIFQECKKRVNYIGYVTLVRQEKKKN
jgi:hypothetical protein